MEETMTVKDSLILFWYIVKPFVPYFIGFYIILISVHIWDRYDKKKYAKYKYHKGLNK